MSDHDTDDTDILLNSDPMGGLFLGLSLKELTDKHGSLMPGTKSPAPPAVVTVAPANLNTGGNNNNDLSDYFNSQGELALSGLSGLSDWTDSESKGGVDGESDGGESDTSFTYSNEDEKKEDHHDAISNGQHNNNGEILDPKNSKDDDTDFRNTSSYKSFIPQFLNHGRVVDINLQNPANGWNIPLPSFMQLQQGPGGSSFLNEKGEQIFTRAPNFRSPNGYQPSAEDKPSRQLSEEQIAEEVKQMYHAADDLEPIIKTSQTSTPHTPKVLRFADEVSQDLENIPEVEENNTKSNGLGFNFLSNTNHPVKFEAPKSEEKSFVRKKNIASKGKRKSNKLLGAGDAASTTSSSDSSPSVIGTNTVPTETVESPLVIPTPPSGTSTSCSSPSVPYCTKVIRGMKRSSKPKPQIRTPPGFSFGYGDSENELSPIRRTGNSCNPPTTCAGNPCRPPPGLGHDDFHDGMGRVKGSAAAMEELKSIWRQIQINRAQLMKSSDEENEDDDDGSRQSFIEDLGKVDASLRNGPSSHHHHGQSIFERSHQPETYANPFPSPSIDNFDSDLETLLNEADINPADFEDIVDDLNIAECDVGAGIDDLLKEIVDPDASPENKETAKISHWAQSGAVEYVERYYEEKFRRHECEQEIDRLQKENLNIRQRNAVLEGCTKRKDATIVKIASAWKEVSQEWREFESTTRGGFEKLKKEHIALTATCIQSKERIEQYEKELMKSVELADSFKTKLVELQASKDSNVRKLEADVTSLNLGIETLSKNVTEITEEKKAAVRALKESQFQLDNLQASFIKLESELHTLKSNTCQKDQKLSEVLNQKSKVESLLQEKVLQNDELINKVKQLTSAIEFMGAEKERLHREHENAISQKLKDEGERLHEYYSKKLQVNLKSAAEKATCAEAALRESMKKAQVDNDRTLAECKERYHSDLTRMKTIYEVEMQELKKDNAQKQLLISTTAERLQRGGVVRSDTVDRLQSIVTNFPNIRDSSLYIGQGDRPPIITATANLPMSQTIREIINKDSNSFNSGSSTSNKEYAKFAQNLVKANTTSKTLSPKFENIRIHPSPHADINNVFPQNKLGTDQKEVNPPVLQLQELINKSQNKPPSS